MIAAELREKTASELRQELVALRKAQFMLRVQRALEIGIRSHNMRSLRRDVARVKTILHEKMQAGN